MANMIIGVGGVIFILPLLTISNCCCTSLQVDLNGARSNFKKFWTHVGFSPLSSSVESTESLLSKDEHINLALMSALPKGAITHVRIHWVLNLIKKRDRGYDWSKLDQLLDWIVELRLNLIFELMGLPRGEPTTLPDWGQLCSRLGHHLLEKYGGGVIQGWMFELWNEPDLKQYNIANFTVQSYLNYAKSCIKGIRSRIPSALIGGPAGLFKNTSNHKFCWGFLDECNSLRNRCGIDYISFHKKNFPRELVAESENLINAIRYKYASLSSLPFYNSESDIVSGWWKPLNFRGDVGYAAHISKIIDLFISTGLRSYFLGISNDNGFMNTHPFHFSQRTLLARFNYTSTNVTQFFKKPVYAATGMLGLLEKFLVHRINNNCSLSAIPTLDQSLQPTLSSIVLLNWEGNLNISDVRVVLPNTWKSVHYTLHVLSNSLDHPRKIWLKHGRPDSPGPLLRSLMRKAEGPHLIHQGLSSGDVRYNWIFPSPSVGLLRICTKFINKPNKVLGLKALNVSFNEVLLIWKDDDARCVRTYEVEFCPDQLNEVDCFRRINDEDIILNSFQFVDYSKHDEESILGRFRVRALNFWGVPGPYSAEHRYPTFTV